MTSTLAQGVGRSPGESVRPLRALAVSPALIVLLLGGLALRLTIAYVLFPSSGFESDLASFTSWALTLAEHGPGGFYEHAGFADYPPAYLYLLWPIGLLAGQAVDAAALAGDLVKLPPILLDIAVSYVIYRLVLGWTWPGRRAEPLALVAAALYLFNPVSFYDSALWGQSDAAGALLLLLGAAALIRGNSEGAAALAATAALVKPQFGVVLIPLVAFVLVKRHLLHPGSGPRQRPWAPAALAGWLAGEQGWPRLVTAFAAAWAAFFALALPFGLGPLEYLERMVGTAGGYAYLTVNAFNPWALIGSGGTPPLAQVLGWSDDTIGLLGPIPGVAIGAALLVAGFLWGTVRAAVRDDRWTLLVALAFLAIAFFVLPTRVHERYIFPAIAVMPLLAVVRGRWAVALLLLSAGAFINLHALLTLPLYGTDNVTSLPLGEWFRSQPLIVVSVVLQSGVGLWAAWQLRPSLRSSPDGFEQAAWSVAAGPSVDPPARAIYPAPVAADAPAAPAPWVRGPGALEWIVDRLSRPASRADRSAALMGERGGRIDRKDALIVVVLILVAVVIRGYRLDQPVGMYFDEVYHARTATEFLQHWEYGQPHDIYEFTHPHLAKYAMAWGIRLAGGNAVAGVTELGVPVTDAVIERRWSPPESPGQRNGDRLYVATGDALRVYDLAKRSLLDELAIPAVAVAVDDDTHTLYIADPAGGLFRLDTQSLETRAEDQRDDGALEALSAGPGAPVERLLVTDTSLVAISRGSISTFDTETGVPLSERFAFAVADAVALPWVERVVVDTRLLTDRPAAARRLGEALDEDPDRIARLLEVDGFVVVDAYLSDEAAAAVREAADEDVLAAVDIESGPLLAVADQAGVSILDAWTLDLIEDLPTAEPVAALVLVEEGLSEPTLYAAVGASLEMHALGDDGPSLPDRLAMPGQIRDLVWNEPANLIHAMGDAPGGGPTVYVVEPHGNAVFIDVPLPHEAMLLLADTQPQRPDEDRGELLAVAAGGTVASVSIDGNAFGWRLPGMLLGALAAGLLYLLARVLFARRSVAVIAAVLIVAEGMFFANSRIGMNDVYVTTFIIVAALLFAPLHLAPRRPWVAASLLLAAGLALGLALASKWVALYAIGGLLLLVLLRSGLGRLIAMVGTITLTAVLGAMAVRPAPVEDPSRNWAFLALMLLLTGLLTAGIVRRPLPIGRGEAWLGIVGLLLGGLLMLVLHSVWPAAAAGGPGDLGSALAGGRLLVAGFGLVLAGLSAWLIAWLAGRFGRGPFGPAVRAVARDVSGWLHPAWLGGLPWLFTLACLTVLPVAVYIVAYAPWVELGNQWGLPLVGSLPFLPEGGDAGKTLPELTRSIYEYHDDLRAEHAASSPWWAWPLDLKPVWFFSEGYAGSTTGLIYDTGNLVIFWLGIAGMGFAGWAAWRRRSLSLALLVIMWAALWLPWARIDRATFQYHVYTSLPFLVLALAYFLAELWHGPSVRVWLLARLAGALAILAIPVMWLLRTPLCILAGTAVAHPDGVACASEVTRTAQISQAGAAALLVVGAGATAAALLVSRSSRLPTISGGESSRRTMLLLGIVIVGLATLAGLIAALLLLDTSSPVALTLNSDLLALAGLIVLAVPAAMVMRARDPRRYVLAALAAALLWLLIWYPNISGLPLPTDLAHIYQGILPTWNWDFQFAVNTDPAVDGGIIDLGTLLVGAVATIFVIGVAIAAWHWGRPGEEPDPAPMTSQAMSGWPDRR